MFCSNCGKPIKDHAEFCGACGKTIETGVKYCGVCGFLSPSNGRFCLNCGAKFAKKKFGKATSGVAAYPVTVQYQKAAYDFLREYGRAEDGAIKLIETKNGENERKADKNAAASSDETARFDQYGYGEPYYMPPFDPYAPPYDPYAAPYAYPPYPVSYAPSPMGGGAPYMMPPYYAPMGVVAPYPVPYAPRSVPAPYFPAPYQSVAVGYPYPYGYGAQDPYFGYGQPIGCGDPNLQGGARPRGGFSYEERFSFGVQPPPRPRPRPCGPMYIPCRDRALKELSLRQAERAENERGKKGKIKKEKVKRVKKRGAKKEE